MLMTQCLSFPSGIDRNFWTSTYQVIDDRGSRTLR
jgi:hypothetical protein